MVSLVFATKFNGADFTWSELAILSHRDAASGVSPKRALKPIWRPLMRTKCSN